MVFRSRLADIEIPEKDLFSFLFGKDRPRGPFDPKKKALVDSITGDFLTFEELSRQIHAAAGGLWARGYSKNDVMAIFSPNTYEYPIPVFAMMALGAPVTTLNPTYTEGEVNYQLTDSSATLLVTTLELIDLAKKAAAGTKIREIFVFGKIGTQGAAPFRSVFSINPPPLPLANFSPNDTIFLPYSSGTTGKAKGVELTHRNLIANILQIDRAESPELDLSKEVWTAVLPLYHVYCFVLVMCETIHLGITNVVVPKFELDDYLRIIQTYKVTIAHIVPPIAIKLAKMSGNQYDLRSLGLFISAAAPLGRETEEELTKKLNIPVKQGYGMTELSPLSTINPRRKIKSGSCGILVSNHIAKIVDPETERELGLNQEGELRLFGPNVMKGYLNRPDANLATFDKEGFLKTGDIAKIDEDGYVYITDRLKELIKFKGFQVAPAELEALLLTHPAVLDASVIPIPDEEAGEVPKGYVSLKPGFPGTPKLSKEIIDFVASKSAPHKRLRGGVEFIDVIPKSPSGKILRRQLRDLEQSKRLKPSSKL